MTHSLALSVTGQDSDVGLKTVFRVGKVLCAAPLARPVLADVANALQEGLSLRAVLLSAVASDEEDLELVARASAMTERLKVNDFTSLPAAWVRTQNQPLLLPDGPVGDARFGRAADVHLVGLPYVGVPIRASSGRVVGVVEMQLSKDASTSQRVAQSVAEMVAELIGEHRGAWWEDTRLPTTSDAEAERTTNYGFESIVGHTPPMRRVFAQVRQVAKWNTTVLIMGESGTGKELIANAIHYSSPRARGPFVKLNCAALPDNLLESELFGHEKGAFTGAVNRHTGRFEQAHRGTLFLDEIGEISPSFQAKLLRVLQEGEYERLGGTQTVRVDVRVIAATNKDLEQEVEENKFRQDLFYRLNVMPIFTPALRERREDIAALAHHLARKLSQVQGRPIEVTDGAVKLLQEHDWPGNVRELENTLERAAIMSDSETIDAEAIVRSGLPVDRATSASSPPVADLRDPNIDERDRLLAALERAGWVQAKAARLLGMTPRQVAYRIQILKIDVPRF